MSVERLLVHLIRIPAPDFDLEKTLNSGQVFHWQKAGKGFVGTIDGRALYVEQRDRFLKVRFGETPKPARETRALPRLVAHYFALDHPLAEICASFPADPIMNAARDFCASFRETITRMRARLSCQAPARDCAVGQFGRM
ncbi:MAG: hypothetical protein DME51_03665 [Verrucomicrobia bacterium]|nr:MAG: hypothetical protein DME51_03665 [Verrucomicrobiota bacterium]